MGLGRRHRRWAIASITLALLGASTGAAGAAAAAGATAAAGAGAGATSRAPLTWSRPQSLTTSTRFARPALLNAISCPSTTLCVGVGSSGQVETSSDPAVPASWHGGVVAPGAALLGVSCPSTGLCVAVSEAGAILTSTNPRGGASAWSRTPHVLSEAFTYLGAVSCPSTSLCVAVTGGGQIATSTNPAGGRSAWTRRTVGDNSYQFDGVACPSASLCLVSDYDGAIVSSTDPTGGASSWSVAEISAANPLLGISCGAPNLCVASDIGGGVWRSTRPGGGVHAWTRAHVDGVNALTAVSCAGGSCVAVDNNGSVLASTSPAGGARAWNRTAGVDPAGLAAIACPLATLCVAGDDAAAIAASTTPLAGSPRWAVGPALGAGARHRADLNAVSCTRVLCAVADSAGDVLSSARLAGAAALWKHETVTPGLSLNGISCTLRRTCVAVGDKGYVASSTDPSGARARWRIADLNLWWLDNNGAPQPDALTQIGCAPALCIAARYSGRLTVELSRNPLSAIWRPLVVGNINANVLSAVACPTSMLCVATAQFGRVAVTTDGGHHWRLPYIQVGPQNGSLTPGVDWVSCPSAHFCAVVGEHGEVITSTDPAGGRRAWHATRIDPGHTLTAISCSSSHLCVAIDRRQGSALVSRTPTAGAGAWRTSRIGHRITGVACQSDRLCVITMTAGRVAVGTAA